MPEEKPVCPRCHAQLPPPDDKSPNLLSCNSCGAQLQKAAPNPDSEVSWLAARYRDAYSVSRWSVELGNMVKTAGAVIAALGAIISAFALALIPQLGLLAILLAGLGLLAALSAGLGLFVLGVGLSCQGQLILAIVDTAVSGNYLATNKEKHQALALFNSL